MDPRRRLVARCDMVRRPERLPWSVKWTTKFIILVSQQDKDSPPQDSRPWRVDILLVKTASYKYIGVPGSHDTERPVLPVRSRAALLPIRVTSSDARKTPPLRKERHLGGRITPPSLPTGQKRTCRDRERPISSSDLLLFPEEYVRLTLLLEIELCGDLILAAAGWG